MTSATYPQRAPLRAQEDRAGKLTWAAHLQRDAPDVVKRVNSNKLGSWIPIYGYDT